VRAFFVAPKRAPARGAPLIDAVMDFKQTGHDRRNLLPVSRRDFCFHMIGQDAYSIGTSFRCGIG